MLKLIRKDLLLLLANWQIGLISLLLMPFLVLVIGADKVSEVMIANIIIMGYFLTTLTFSYEIRIKPYLLIQSLPLKRSEVVISRYLSTFINFIIGVVYTVTYLWVIKYFNILNVDSFNIYLIKEALLIIMLGLSISLAGFFILKPKIATIITTSVYLIGLNFFFIQPETSFRRYEIPNEIGIIIVVLYFVSLGLSLWFYERKDLT